MEPNVRSAGRGLTPRIRAVPSARGVCMGVNLGARSLWSRSYAARAGGLRHKYSEALILFNCAGLYTNVV